MQDQFPSIWFMLYVLLTVYCLITPLILPPGIDTEMAMRLRIWKIGLGVVAVLAVGAFATWGSYRWGWDWTGIGPFPRPERDLPTGYQRGKTIWDVFQLLILPLAVVSTAAAFSWLQKSRELDISRESREDEALENYLTSMSSLLLNKDSPLVALPKEETIGPREIAQTGLLALFSMIMGQDMYADNSQEASSFQPKTLARAWTLAVLSRINGQRKGVVIRFLYESQLINRPEPIVDLHDTNLVAVNLTGAVLTNADLSGADLKGAIMRHATLVGCLFRDIDLTDADLYGAYVHRAEFDAAKVTPEQLSQAISEDITVSREARATM